MNEDKLTSDYLKVVQIIESCTTKEHLEVSYKVVAIFLDKEEEAEELTSSLLTIWNNKSKEVLGWQHQPYLRAIGVSNG